MNLSPYTAEGDAVLRRIEFTLLKEEGGVFVKEFQEFEKDPEFLARIATLGVCATRAQVLLAIEAHRVMKAMRENA